MDLKVDAGLAKLKLTRPIYRINKFLNFITQSLERSEKIIFIEINSIGRFYCYI